MARGCTTTTPRGRGSVWSIGPHRRPPEGTRGGGGGGARVPSDGEWPADGRAPLLARRAARRTSGRTQLRARPRHPAPAEALDTADPVSRGCGGAPGFQSRRASPETGDSSPQGVLVL